MHFYSFQFDYSVTRVVTTQQQTTGNLYQIPVAAKVLE
jgi:hypothetical protein